MKISEATQHMTKWYLQRVVDSFTKDFPKPDEDRAREIIVGNAEELTAHDRIANQLALSGSPYSERILVDYILRVLLDDPDHMSTEAQIVEAVTRAEQEILERPEDPDSLQYEDDHAVEVLGTVLEVSVEDDRISDDELRLIDRLRVRLGVQEESKQVLLARLDHFPRSGNREHSPSDVRDALTDLQKRGIVFYCNRLENGRYLIPDELVPGVKAALGFELGEKPWRLLLDQLMKPQLQTILSEEGLPKYGRKAQLVERVVAAGVRPSEALDRLNSSELYDLLSDLPGANVSGTKDERIARLIDYFANLVLKEVDEEASPGERYYEYLVELATRDRENLLANDVIGKDRDMDAAFEEGTRYLFREKLGLELLKMSGSDHCDGCLEFGATGEIFMWDQYCPVKRSTQSSNLV